MNPEAQEVLKKILAKTPEELTVHDRAFLRARWSYIGRNSRKRFQAILDMKEESTEAQEEASITPEDPYKQEDDGQDEA